MRKRPQLRLELRRGVLLTLSFTRNKDLLNEEERLIRAPYWPSNELPQVQWF